MQTCDNHCANVTYSERRYFATREEPEEVDWKLTCDECGDEVNEDEFVASTVVRDSKSGHKLDDFTVPDKDEPPLYTEDETDVVEPSNDNIMF